MNDLIEMQFLEHGDLRPGLGDIDFRIGNVEAADVDAARDQPAAQDVEHLLELKIAGRELGDENAYHRYLERHGRHASGEEWRRFSEERLRARYARAKCC